MMRKKFRKDKKNYTKFALLLSPRERYVMIILHFLNKTVNKLTPINKKKILR